MISEAILIPKIYARLQEIASNFSKFSGGGPPDPPPALRPSALVSGLRPLTGPPFPKFLDPPLIPSTEHNSGLFTTAAVSELEEPNFYANKTLLWPELGVLNQGDHLLGDPKPGHNKNPNCLHNMP